MDNRQKKILAHLAASSNTPIEVPEVAKNPGSRYPQTPVDDKTYSRRMEHVARSLGAFYKRTSASSEQVVEHLNLTAGQ